VPAEESGAYGDPHVPLIHEELSKYCVSIIPIIDAEERSDGRKNADPLNAGSGTCLRIGGRFFVATAAHVISPRPPNMHFVATPTTEDGALKIINGGYRGGGKYDPVDVGWLELHGRAAAQAGRAFLDIARVRTGCVGDEELVVLGAPVQQQERGKHADGTPVLKTGASWWATRGILDARDLAEAPDPARKLFLRWPSRVEGTDGEWYEYPEPGGMSGGGVWATNVRHAQWRASNLQLVGIEYAFQRVGAPDRYLKACQIQVWLEMLREDVPELACHIDPLLGAGDLALR